MCIQTYTYTHRNVQFSSVAQSCPTLCNPMNHSTPGLPVHHQLPEFTQTHVNRVSDAIQPSHPLSSPSPPAPNPSQHQSLFQWVSSSHEYFGHHIYKHIYIYTHTHTHTHTHTYTYISLVAQTVKNRRLGSDPWVRKIPWRREWLLILVFLLGEFRPQRSLVGYSPWGHKELNMTEWLTLSLSCICINWFTLLYSRNFLNRVLSF